jgi:hypothetical protein
LEVLVLLQCLLGLSMIHASYRQIHLDVVFHPPLS